jgi:four helix bundle protein
MLLRIVSQGFTTIFDHERFEAYQLAIAYWGRALEIIRAIPPGSSSVKDQLVRAASSIALYIAEGSGRTKIDDRKRYYSIARGSAMECAAISDLLVHLEPKLKEQTDSAKNILHSIVCILSKVILK